MLPRPAQTVSYLTLLQVPRSVPQRGIHGQSIPAKEAWRHAQKAGQPHSSSSTVAAAETIIRPRFTLSCDIFQTFLALRIEKEIFPHHIDKVERQIEYTDEKSAAQRHIPMLHR